MKAPNEYRNLINNIGRISLKAFEVAVITFGVMVTTRMKRVKKAIRCMPEVNGKVLMRHFQKHLDSYLWLR